MTSPVEAAPGQFIAHDLLPEMPVQVEDARACITDTARPLGHDSYLVTDPEGHADWVCAYDFHLAGGEP